MSSDTTERAAESFYGFCPHCNAPGVERERRPDGNDTCANGHVYPSKDAIYPCILPPKESDKPGQ